MPLYEVIHAIRLSRAQKDELAQAITAVHTRRFTTPSIFVNIKFTDALEQTTYVGGWQRHTNRITGLVRAGPSRTDESYNELSREIEAAWYTILCKNHKNRGRGPRGGIAPGDDRELHMVTVVGSILAGLEYGFARPPAGGDKEWLREHLPEFQKLAVEGHAQMMELVQEVKTRADLQGVAVEDTPPAYSKS